MNWFTRFFRSKEKEPIDTNYVDYDCDVCGQPGRSCIRKEICPYWSADVQTWVDEQRRHRHRCGC